MHSGPKVTIGVPVFNGASTLSRSLDCLARQTYRNIEVVISDNASTDGSAAIAHEFAQRDSRFRLVQHEANIGSVPNFRFLLDVAETELFMWRADDDWSDLDYVEKLVSILDRNPVTVLAACESVLVTPSGTLSESRRFPVADQRWRAFRIGYTLMNLGASSIYGIWRKPALVETLDRTLERFPHVWGWDYIALMPIVLDERIQGTNETRLYVGSPDSVRYPVKRSAADMWELRRAFRNECIAEVATREWSWWEKPIIWMFSIRYSNKCSFRFWKTVRRQVREILEVRLPWSTK